MSQQSYRFVVETQIQENYGAHDWDGSGSCPQHWKNKGGRSHVLLTSATPPSEVEQMQALSDWQPENNEWFRESLISSRLLSPGEETDDERLSREIREWQASW